MLDCEEKEEKRCYGLDIPVEGKPRWIYENPYTYIEKQGCKPIDDYFLNRYMEEEAPLDNPVFIDGPYGSYNVMMYSPSGETTREGIKNKIASCFCCAFIYGTSPIHKYPWSVSYDGMIILPSIKRTFTQEDKRQIKQMLKDLEWFE